MFARAGEEETMYCFDLKTGEPKWRNGYAAPFKMGGGGEWHGKGPKSHPVLADGRLFTMGISGIFSAWDAGTGKRLWHKDYGEKYEKPTPYWGACTSPIVDENRVMIHFGGDEAGELVAFDVASGDQIWTHGKSGASYSSPLIADLGGIRQVIEWNHDSLVGVESKSGKLLWEYPFPHEATNQNMPTPSVHDGRIYLGGENRGLHCFEPKLADGKWTVKELWKQEKVALDMSSAVVNGSFLYGMSHYGRGRLFCVNTENGEILWQSPGRIGDNVTFLAIPGHIIALLDKGELQVVAASASKYEKLASYEVAELPTWSPPVLLEEGFLIKDQQNLIYWKMP